MSYSTSLASAEPSTLGTVSQWAVDIMESLGSVGAAIAIAAENLFPPIPSEVILPLAGFTASRGSFGVLEVILMTTLGSVLGALALYGLGAWFGPDRLRAIVARLPLMKVSDVDKAEDWFSRHGNKAVFFGRMIPLFRSLISIPAGIERMPLVLFLALTTAGSAIWNTVFVLAGYYLGENWKVVEDYADVLQKVVIIAVIVGVVWFAVTRIRASIRTRSASVNESIGR